MRMRACHGTFINPAESMLHLICKLYEHHNTMRMSGTWPLTTVRHHRSFVRFLNMNSLTTVELLYNLRCNNGRPGENFPYQRRRMTSTG